MKSFPQKVADKFGEEYEIWVTEESALTVYFELRFRKRKAGYVFLTKKEKVLEIADFCIFEQLRVPLPRVLFGIFTRCRVVRMRGRGLGAAVLAAVLEYARGGGFASIEGRITESDVQKTPHLVSFYQGRGFDVVQGPREMRIVLDLPPQNDAGTRSQD